jgi:hypothetical protein
VVRDGAGADEDESPGPVQGLGGCAEGVGGVLLLGSGVSTKPEKSVAGGRGGDELASSLLAFAGRAC